MHRKNYFVSLRHAHPQPVYEYHPLFREFVQSRASALPRERRNALQRESSRLLSAEGLVAEAALLARAAGDWERIEEIIRRHARAMLDSGRSETLAQWAEALPQEVHERNPWTLYWLAIARMQTSPRAGRMLHERAHDLFLRAGRETGKHDPLGLLFTCSGAMDAILYEVDDYSLLDRWIDVMIELMGAYPGLVTGAQEARVACSLFTSMVARQPHHPEIELWGDRAYRASVGQNDTGVRLSVEPRVALGIAYGGHFPKALAIIDGIREVARTADVPPVALTMMKLVEATYYMLTAQREPCVRAAREGLDIERAEGINLLSRQLLAYGAGGALAADDLDTAEDFLRSFAAMPATTARFDLCLYHLFSGWLALRRHDAVAAYQQQKLALKAAVEVGCPVFEVLCRTLAAQVRYDGGELREALAEFAKVYDIARRIRNHLLEFTGLMNYAWVGLDSGRRPRSGLRALRRALAVGKPRDYTTYLLWRPGPLARLCSIALEQGIETEFVRKVVRDRRLALDARDSALVEWPWPFRVHTLSGFRLLRQGVPVTFSGKAQRRPLDLLKAVIALGGRDVPEERVTEALWPRIDGDSAHRSFTTTLHRLRKLLGEDRAIVLSEGRLSLDGRLVWVDAWAVAQAASRINELLRPGQDRPDLERLAALCERMLDLRRGAFLASDPDAAWILPTRERDHHRFVRALCDAARACCEHGSPQRAADLLERAIDVEPAAEALYRQLMLSLDALDRRADAVETYERLRRLLSAMSAPEPSAETRALHARLLAAEK